MSTYQQNNKLVKELQEIADRSFFIHPGRLASEPPDAGTGIITVYADEMTAQQVIDIVTVFHKLNRNFKMTSWGESKKPCFQTVK